MKLFFVGLSYIIIISLLIVAGYGLYLMYQIAESITLVIAVVYLFNVIFSVIILIQRRHAEAKVSWLFVMFILPITGHVLFTIFSLRYDGRKNRSIYHTKPSFGYEIKQAASDAILKKLSILSARGVYNSDIHLFERGDIAFEALFADLRKAKKWIHLQYYIIKPGEIYEEFKSILIEKAKEGVEVRLIVDDFGRWALPWYEIKELEASKVRVGIFGRVYFPFFNSKNNYRNHRKVAIIDGEIAHVGGINIANEYANIDPKFGVWMDSQNKISGPLVRSLQLLFIDDWKIVTKENLETNNYLVASQPMLSANSSGVLVESSPEIKDSPFQDALLLMIAGAKKSIILTTPYLILTQELESALRAAASSGVDISIHIPGKADKKSVFIGTKLFAKYLSSYGVKIYEHPDMFLHTKMGIFDNEYVYFGSSNLDFRSIYSQFEITIFARGKIVDQSLKLIGDYEKTARQLKGDDLKRSVATEWLERVFVNILSPIM